MFYGYVGPDIKTVFDSFKPIERLKIIYPYSSFRKFKYESDAWEWVRCKHTKKAITSVNKYGNIFKLHCVDVDYIITEEYTYYNIHTDRLGYVHIDNDNPDILVNNCVDNIMVRIKISLNNDLILSHLVAIYQILELLGPFIDVNLILPNHSIFYALTSYTGKQRRITKVLKYIENRKGNVAYTLKCYKESQNEKI